MSTKREVAIAELWRRGLLKWKCHAVQKEMYDLFYSSPKHSTLVWLLARQIGKSYLLAILALEQAIRKPNSIIKAVTDTKLHVKSIFEKIFLELLIDCPEHLKPEFKSQQYIYYFPNGSQIQLAGSDNKHYEKLRGQKADLVLVDEAGFCSNLQDMIKSVLFPTTTHTGGRIILASTPPEDGEHDFLKFIEEADQQNTLVKKTIYDNPLLNIEHIQRIVDQMGGVHSERFRREYLCEIIKNSDTSVIPEFTEELEKQVVKEWPKPPFYDCYVAMDLGGVDLTAVLFGYYDFRADKIVIQDEIIMDFGTKENNIEKLCRSIQEKEIELWMNLLTNEKKEPYARISDINYIVTKEILKYSNNKIVFQPAKKDDKDAAISNVRLLLSNKKIIINPKCINLIRHLRHVKWKSANNKSEFARSNYNGHYDAVDALIYFIRHANFKKNPYPAHYELNLRRDDVFVSNPTSYNEALDPHEVFRRIFSVKKRKY